MQRGLSSRESFSLSLLHWHSQNFTKRKWFLIAFGPRWAAAALLLCQNYGHLEGEEEAKLFGFRQRNPKFLGYELQSVKMCHPWAAKAQLRPFQLAQIFNPSKHFQKEFYAFAIILNALYGALKKVNDKRGNVTILFSESHFIFRDISIFL